MVNKGPAKGCQRCKDRHVKCGLERPACFQCTRLKFNCPGYRHELDIMLRDETASVIRHHRNKSKRCRGTAKPGPQTDNSNNLKSFLLPKDVAPPFDCVVLPFLFGSHDPMQDQRTSHGHFDFLPRLYQQATTASPLHSAISWLAFLLIGILLDNDANWWHQHYTEESRLMAGAIRSIQTAIADPNMSIQTDTLTAVMLLGYGEHLRSTPYELVPPYSSILASSRKMTGGFMIHQTGAEALIRKRGALNFQDSASRAIFTAVRHNAVSIAMSGMAKVEMTTATINWDLWDAACNESFYLCDSYTPATELDACGAKMVILRRHLRTLLMSAYDNYSEIQILQKDLLGLLERLNSWPSYIPLDWKTGHQQNLSMKVGILDSLSVSPEVCYLFNQWNLLQIGVSHLFKQLDTITNTSSEHTYTKNDFFCEEAWIDRIIASSKLSLGYRPPITDPILVPSKKTSAHISSVRQFCVARRGLRFFGQTLQKLDNILSDAMESLDLPEAVYLRYREVVNWARSEQHDRIDNFQRSH